MILSNKTKGIFVIIGGIFMHILTGTVHVWASLYVYLISYLIQFDPSISLSTGFFLGPLGVFSMCLSMSLGGFLERNYGPRQVTALGLAFIILGHVVIYFSHNLYLDYFAMIISGMGIGCNYLIPMRLGFKYFPNNKGLVSGFVQIGLAFTATFLNIIAESIINPEGKNPDIIIDGNTYFQKDIAERVKIYIIYFFIGSGVLGILTIILFFPYHPENESPQIDSNQGLIPEEESNEVIETHNQQKEENKMMEGIIKVNSVGDAIKHKAFWLILLTALFSDILPPLVCNTFRVYAQNNGYTSVHLKFLQSGFSGTNSFLRPLWGFLFDLIGFKALLFPTNLILIVIGSTLFYTIQIKWLFTVLVVLSGLLMGIIFSIFPAYTGKVYGIKLSSEIYGLVFVGIGLASLLGPTFFFIIQGFIKKSIVIPFMIAYFIGAGFAFLGCITCFFAPSEKKKINVEKLVEENKEDTF